MSWFYFYFENPYKTWWKARKYFKRPRMKFHWILGKATNAEYCDYNYPFIFNYGMAKILSVVSFDALWKSKWGEARYEQSPVLWVTFCNIIGFYVTFNVDYQNEIGLTENGDENYWEYLLNFLYYRQGLKSALGCTWRDSLLWEKITRYGNKEDGSKDEKTPFPYVIPTHLFSLNKRGLRKLQSIIKEIKK